MQIETSDHDYGHIHSSASTASGSGSKSGSVSTPRKNQVIITEKDISSQQLALITTMSKYVVLVSISLITTFMSFGIQFIRSILIVNGASRQDDLPLLYLFYLFSAIDYFTNIICFMTQYVFFGKKSYYKYCKRLDNGCQKFVKKKTVKKMNQERSFYDGASVHSVASVSPTTPSQIEVVE